MFELPVFSALLRCNDRHLGSIIEEKAYFQAHEGRAEQDRIREWGILSKEKNVNRSTAEERGF